MADIYNEVAYNAAFRRNIHFNAMKTFCRTYEHGQKVANFLQDYDGNNDFLLSMKDAINTYGKLTEKQYLAMVKMFERWEERKAGRDAEYEKQKAQSAYVGEVGKRAEFNLTVKAVIEVEKPRFHYHDTPFSYIYIMEDENKNKVVYRGDWKGFDKDTKVKVKASVKEHAEYKGEKQTIIQRPKFEVIEQEQE